MCGDAGGIKGGGLVQMVDGTDKKVLIGSYTDTTAIAGCEYVCALTHHSKHNATQCIATL